MPVCPYYGQGEEFCDVGADYISPHDVEAISHFCSCRYSECDKFRELAVRCPERLERSPAAARVISQPVRLAQLELKRPPIRIRFRNKWPLSFRLHCLAHRCYSTEPTREENTLMSKNIKNPGWRCVVVGTGINLALGILYTWSIFKGAIVDSIGAGGKGAFTWDAASVNDPYAVACLAFAVAMILAGKCQDKFGPKLTCFIGGLMVAAGFVWISQTTDYWAWVVGFGILAGTGIGFGYSAATPPALKWFPPAKTGLVAGIVVSGFGLASVYIAPLAKYLLSAYGLQQAMFFFGIAFAVAVCSLGLLIVNPPEGFVPEPGAKVNDQKTTAVAVNLKPAQLFSNGKFYILWLCYFIGSGAGLMVIGSAKGLAKASMGEMAFLVVVIMSVGNAAGRLVAGMISDKIGRAATLSIMLLFQAGLMFAAIPIFGGTAASPLLVCLLVTCMVFNYGTNLSLFPSFAKDFWGMKNFGMNYGILFSAWGVGAFVLVRVSEMLKVKTGSMETSFIVAGALLLIGAMMSLSLRPKRIAVVTTEQVVAEDEDLVLQQVRD